MDKRPASELQQFLKDRGVVFSGARKPELIELCQLAEAAQLEYDPDGYYEDREEIVREKLIDDFDKTVQLINPGGPFVGNIDLSILPYISELDMCSYLMKCNNASNNGLNHALFRDKTKSEPYTMMLDGFVESISIVTLLEGQYYAIKGQVSRLIPSCYLETPQYNNNCYKLQNIAL